MKIQHFYNSNNFKILPNIFVLLTTNNKKQNLISDPLIVENFDDNLPKTVSLLTSREGAKVYLIGTAHFSLESMDDVSKVSLKMISKFVP